MQRDQSELLIIFLLLLLLFLLFLLSGEPDDRTSGTATRSPSAQTFSITVTFDHHYSAHTLAATLAAHFSPPSPPLLWPEQTTWTAWAPAWRTGACTAWRTAACSWSAAPSRRGRSSTGSCRSPTTTASTRCVRPRETLSPHYCAKSYTFPASPPSSRVLRLV